jgi:hypothetical protein
MKKLFLLNLSLLTVGLLGVNTAEAQSAKEILGARFIVEAPASISGVKAFTYSSQVTDPWGAALTSHESVEVVKVNNLGCVAGDFPSSVSGKWALIKRGDCQFGTKAKNAQTAGAAGVIIWNHSPFELINMAAGDDGGSVTIPVVFVTNEAGAAMEANASAPVFISITPWGFGKDNDLALVSGSPAPPPGFAIPYHQMSTTDVAAYRGYTGATVVNTGANTQTNVKVKSVVSQGSTVVFQDSVILPSFPVNDSVHILASPTHYNFNSTTVGTYTINYTVSSDSVDEYSFDNSGSLSFQVSPNVFSRGRFDAAKQQPAITRYTKVTGGLASTWGPMFYNRVGGYQMSHITLGLADDDTSRHSLTQSTGGEFIDVYMFKWTDGNSDGMMQGGELDLKGIAVKEFTADDSVKKPLTAYIGDAVNGASAKIVSENDSRYWFAVNLGTVFLLGVDDANNYYTREFAASKAATTNHDFWGPAIFKTKADIAASDIIKLMPFGVTDANSSTIDSADYLQQEAIPAVAVFTSVFVNSTKDVVKDNQLSVYPNPATSEITASLNLNSNVEKAYVKVIDAFGKQVYLQKLNNVQKAEVKVSIGNLAPGNYYMVLITGDSAVSRPFTVVGQ